MIYMLLHIILLMCSDQLVVVMLGIDLYVIELSVDDG